jgi:hypothetical protein
MKRTRRVEITMYSRRVMVTQSSDAMPPTASRLSAIEVSTEMRERVASVLEELNLEGPIANEPIAVQLPRQRPFYNLRDWLRRRF